LTAAKTDEGGEKKGERRPGTISRDPDYSVKNNFKVRRPLVKMTALIKHNICTHREKCGLWKGLGLNK